MATIRGTAKKDRLSGTNAADKMFGLAGHDTLLGKTGNDTLDGGDGNDTLDGGKGRDTMKGGKGNDTYIADNTGDKVIEKAGQGLDLVKSSVTHTLSANVENLTLTGAGAIKGTGNALANTITGNAGNNVINGGAGADTLKGGAGNDTYVVDNAGDTITDTSGSDTVLASIDFLLGSGLENLTLTGAASAGTGNELDNTITGNGASNVLLGGSGNDTLIGGAGNDTLEGGNGNDRLEGGGGADSLRSGFGADVFVFRAEGDSGTTAGTRDVLQDFIQGADKIDLSALDASLYLDGDQSFFFSGAFGLPFDISGGPLNPPSFGAIRYQYDAMLNATIVQVNIAKQDPVFQPDTGFGTHWFNPDLTIDLEIQIAGNIALLASDFVL